MIVEKSKVISVDRKSMDKDSLFSVVTRSSDFKVGSMTSRDEESTLKIGDHVDVFLLGEDSIPFGIYKSEDNTFTFSNHKKGRDVLPFFMYLLLWIPFAGAFIVEAAYDLLKSHKKLVQYNDSNIIKKLKISLFGSLSSIIISALIIFMYFIGNMKFMLLIAIFNFVFLSIILFFYNRIFSLLLKNDINSVRKYIYDNYYIDFKM